MKPDLFQLHLSCADPKTKHTHGGGAEGGGPVNVEFLSQLPPFLLPHSEILMWGSWLRRRDPVQIQHKDSFVSLGQKPGERQSDGCAATVRFTVSESFSESQWSVSRFKPQISEQSILMSWKETRQSAGGRRCSYF